MVTKSTNSGHLGGSNGADTLTGVAQPGTGQIHVYAQAGNDTINLDFANINKFSMGHHARGDGSLGPDDTSTNRGDDTFNFRNVHRVDHVVVGRIEDFDSSRDKLQINGNNITLSQLQSGSGTTGGYSWRIVEYDADSRDNTTDKQQWILINTGQGHIFYALEGARVTGTSASSQQELHFIGAMGGHRVTASELSNLNTVGYVDPVNYVPDGYTAQGGVTINDDDEDWADVNAWINGSSSGDLIAAGLNDDKVNAGSGNDIVWGGSGDDSIRGGNGNDTIYGNTNNDTINGDSGDDRIYGGDGNDQLTGGTGNDRLYGGDDNDVLSGWGGNDLEYGGNGNDRLYGQEGNDRLYGGNGNDQLYASTDNDSMFGGSGNDLLNGGAGTDRATGGSGADVFEFKTGDLMDWDTLGGSWTSKNNQLDLITDFAVGTDRIEFDNYSNVDDMSDLRSWKTTIDGNVHYTVQVWATNERILVDVNDQVSWSQFFDADNFLFV